MKRNLFALGVIFAVVLSACGSGSGAAGAQGGSSSAGISSGQLLFQDDFSTPDPGWSLKDSGDFVVEYADGAMRVFADNDTSPYGFNLATYDQSFGDVHIEVDVQRLSGDDSASIYLICHYQDNDNYIIADIDFEGEARLGAFIKNEQQIAVDQEGLSLLKDGVNHLSLDCVGHQVTFQVNGTVAASGEVGGPVQGGIGFSAGGSGQGQNDFRFDNQAVYAP